MNIQQPSIDVQAKSLIAQTKFELVCRVLKKDILEVSDYDLVFTISRAEFLCYLRKNCTFEKLVKTHFSHMDGFYALKNGIGWLTFRQERGIRFDAHHVFTKKGVLEQYATIQIGI